MPVAATGPDPLTVGVTLPARKTSVTSASIAVCISSRTPSRLHLLQHLAQLPLGAEQLIDLSADALR